MTDRVRFIEKGLVRRTFHSFSHFVGLELVAVVCSDDAVFDYQRIVHVIEVVVEVGLLVISAVYWLDGLQVAGDAGDRDALQR